MKHILYLDPLERLNPIKDSTLMLALTLQKQGQECYLLFKDDLQLNSSKALELEVYSFQGSFDANKSFYLNSFELGEKKIISIGPGWTLHQRLDPPFDQSYLKSLWLLRYIESKGVRVLNAPRGISAYNEKIFALEFEGHTESYVGSLRSGAEGLLESCPADDYIIKPFDSFSGFGVEKIEKSKVVDRFLERTRDEGALMLQAFNPAVFEGEYRVSYYGDTHLGTILKRPQKGEYLSNIAQGAAFEKSSLPDRVHTRILEVQKQLADVGVFLVAYDVLGESITEINTTCPGLMVELSHACGENMWEKVLEVL